MIPFGRGILNTPETTSTTSALAQHPRSPISIHFGKGERRGRMSGDAAPFQSSKTEHMLIRQPAKLIHMHRYNMLGGCHAPRLESNKLFWNFGAARAHGVFTHSRRDKVPIHTSVNDKMLS